MQPPSDAWESTDTVDVADMVRPYTLTAGRTAARVDLPLEAPVSPSTTGPAPRWPSSDVRARILALAENSPSVAEAAARLELPLGVARVLIGDLVVEGYLRVHTTLGDTASLDDRRELIGRTLRGLRAL
ncbi:DUF742 domain-containing protein [Mycobacterium sp. AMU20-3851]|uniref:DUF742 domain-containing protein n=1 Tax=Mycobacterium sp. AMU20-3851 TaxID=3122055 RepID=UPI003754E9CC